MHRALISFILMAGAAHIAVAAEPTPFEWTKENFELAASGDIAQGKKLAKKLKCQKCHNKDGISDDEEIPSIAGQRATYMFKQFADFKSKVRESSDMYKVARKMSEEDMVHVSAYYESMERPEMVGGEPMLVIKVCDSCHDKDIVEEDNQIEVAPILKGQMRQYLEASMMMFKDADRSNDLFGRMQGVSHKLTDEEIKRLTAYYGAEDLPEDE